MHYLVTGGAGFIGSHLSDILLRAGFGVTVLDDLSSGKRDHVPSGAELVVGDCGDAESIRPLIPRVDGVFHLAAVASVEQSRQRWHATHRINQSATVALLEAVAKREGGPIPFVYASSAAVYGDPPPEALPLKESQPPQPLTPYGVDKLACELQAQMARQAFGIPTLGLRFFNVFGPRQDPSSPYSGVISIFCNKIAKGEPITLFGDGGQTRDFIYVTDVVLHLVAAMKLLKSGVTPDQAALNVCTGQQVSIRFLAETIAGLSGQTLQIEHAPPRHGDIRHSCGNPAVAMKWLSVPASVTLATGLSKTLSWMKR